MSRSAVLLLLLVAGCMPSARVEPSPPVEPAPPVAMRAIDAASTAWLSAQAALAGQDGAALLRAAQQFQRSGAQPFAASEGSLDRIWIARAAQWGAPDRSPPLRGRVLGPAYREGALRAGAALSTQQSFLAGKEAEIVIVSSRPTALALKVVDRAGASVCPDMVSTEAGRKRCHWRPAFTSHVTINLTNTGDRDVAYLLLSN